MLRRSPYSSAEAINADNEDVEALRAEIVAWRGFDAAAAPARGGRSDPPDRPTPSAAARPRPGRAPTEDILRAGAGVSGADEDELRPGLFSARDGATRASPRPTLRAPRPSFAAQGAARRASPSKSPLHHHNRHPHVHAVEDGELDVEDGGSPRPPQEPGADDAAATAIVRRRHRVGFPGRDDDGSASPGPA